MGKITTRAQYLARYRTRGAQMAPKTRTSDVAWEDGLYYLRHKHGVPSYFVPSLHRIGHGSRPNHSSRTVQRATLDTHLSMAVLNRTKVEPANYGNNRNGEI